jgi:hypothetical protein
MRRLDDPCCTARANSAKTYGRGDKLGRLLDHSMQPSESKMLKERDQTITKFCRKQICIITVVSSPFKLERTPRRWSVPNWTDKRGIFPAPL